MNLAIQLLLLYSLEIFYFLNLRTLYVLKLHRLYIVNLEKCVLNTKKLKKSLINYLKLPGILRRFFVYLVSHK